MPPIQIIHDRHLADSCTRFKERVCSINKSEPNPLDEPRVAPEPVDNLKDPDTGGSVKHYKFTISDESTITIAFDEQDPPKMTLLNRYFSGMHNKIIHKFRYAIVFIFFTFGAICVYFGSQIGPLTE